jgi:hypothetical protein
MHTKHANVMYPPGEATKMNKSTQAHAATREESVPRLELIGFDVRQQWEYRQEQLEPPSLILDRSHPSLAATFDLN